jgi:hypothetical protein
MAWLAQKRCEATVNQARSWVNAYHGDRPHRHAGSSRSEPGTAQMRQGLQRFGEPYPRPLLPEGRERGIIEISHANSRGDFIGGVRRQNSIQRQA